MMKKLFAFIKYSVGAVFFLCGIVAALLAFVFAICTLTSLKDNQWVPFLILMLIFGGIAVGSFALWRWAYRKALLKRSIRLQNEKRQLQIQEEAKNYEAMGRLEAARQQKEELEAKRQVKQLEIQRQIEEARYEDEIQRERIKQQYASQTAEQEEAARREEVEILRQRMQHDAEMDELQREEEIRKQVEKRIREEEIERRIRKLNEEREALEKAKQEKVDKYKRSEAELDRIDGMEGHEFEHYCAELLKKNGFVDVSVTRGSGDQGVDILATKNNIRYAIQCKNYATKLSNTPIQEVNAGRIYYNCHVGAVMTNSTFSKGAEELAASTNVLLWDREDLQTLIIESL